MTTIKTLLTSSVIAASVLLTVSSCNKEEVLSSADIPTEISSYITTHFGSHNILQVVKDKDGFTKTYDIILSDNISLEFNRKKEVISIDGTTQLPNSVIPEKILSYVTANFPNNFITDWELDNKKQQVQLNNDMELEFNKNGDFLRIED